MGRRRRTYPLSHRPRAAGAPPGGGTGPSGSGQAVLAQPPQRAACLAHDLVRGCGNQLSLWRGPLRSNLGHEVPIESHLTRTLS